MKQILFLFLIGFATCTYAQSEFNSKFKAIPPTAIKPKAEKKVTPPPPDLGDVIPPKIYKNPNGIQTAPKPLSDFDTPLKSEVSMVPKDEFINPGDEVRDRLNKRPDRQEGLAYRRNQDLGTYKTTANAANVMYRDAQAVDGDLIRVYLNGKVIQSQVFLDSNFKGFEITLQKGFNKIDFEALNQGSSGPNTAEFRVYDDKKNLISASEWNLGTGFKATIIVVKE